MQEFDEENIVTLNFTNGDSVTFDIVGLIPYKNKDYAILKPVVPFGGMKDDECILFEMTGSESTKEFSLVEDDKIIDSVFKEYLKMLKE